MKYIHLHVLLQFCRYTFPIISQTILLILNGIAGIGKIELDDCCWDEK